jgi:hypothetical protein
MAVSSSASLQQPDTCPFDLSLAVLWVTLSGCLPTSSAAALMSHVVALICKLPSQHISYAGQLVALQGFRVSHTKGSESDRTMQWAWQDIQVLSVVNGVQQHTHTVTFAGTLLKPWCTHAAMWMVFSTQVCVLVPHVLPYPQQDRTGICLHIAPCKPAAVWICLHVLCLCHMTGACVLSCIYHKCMWHMLREQSSQVAHF